MNKLLWFLLFTSFTQAVHANELLTVFNVKGKILLQSTKQPLVVGDVLNINDKIQFGTVDASAIVYSSIRGRVLLHAVGKETKTAVKQFWLTVKQNMIPTVKTGVLSSRDINPSYISDLRECIGNEQFLIIGNEQALQLNPEKYKLDKNSYFCFQYEFQGKKVIKQIRFSGQTIFLNRQELFTDKENGGSLLMPVTLYQVIRTDAKPPETKLISSCTLLFIEENIFRKECQTVVSAYKISRKDELGIRITDEQALKKVLLDYIIQTYSNTHYPALDKWLKENISFKL
jgi:hypothetical protein